MSLDLHGARTKSQTPWKLWINARPLLLHRPACDAIRCRFRFFIERRRQLQRSVDAAHRPPGRARTQGEGKVTSPPEMRWLRIGARTSAMNSATQPITVMFACPKCATVYRASQYRGVGTHF